MVVFIYLSRNHHIGYRCSTGLKWYFLVHKRNAVIFRIKCVSYVSPTPRTNNCHISNSCKTTGCLTGTASQCTCISFPRTLITFPTRSTWISLLSPLCSSASQSSSGCVMGIIYPVNARLLRLHQQTQGDTYLQLRACQSFHLLNEVCDSGVLHCIRSMNFVDGLDRHLDSLIDTRNGCCCKYYDNSCYTERFEECVHASRIAQSAMAVKAF